MADPTLAAAPSPAPRPARALLVALATALACLAVLELGARGWLARDPPPHSYDEPRNPGFRRDWKAYTAPRERDRDRLLVVVLGNSQGFLREHPDGSRTYSARLAAGLAGRGVDATVANWSVPGGQGPELVVLAARAAQHAPDLVLLSAGTRPFGAPRLRDAPLSYWLSDVTDLAYLHDVRRRLPVDFLRRADAYDPLAFLRAHSEFLRLREALESDRERRAWNATPRRKRPKRRLGLVAPDVELIRTLLSELSGALRSDGARTPLLLVNMPICSELWQPEGYRRAAALSIEAERLFAADPTTRVLDARDVVDDDLFATATHLTPTGHQAYADWLLPHVLDLLARREPGAPR